jgi:hypothetical protein
LIVNSPIKRRTINSLFNPELVEMGTRDLLKRQPVGNILISLNSMRSNDVSVNLIIGVNFLTQVSPKSCVIFQALPLFALWMWYKNPAYPLQECFFIFSFWISLYLLLHQNEAMSALDWLREIKQKETELRRERERGNGTTES